MKHNRLISIALLAALLTQAAACGGSSTSADTTSAGADTTAPTEEVTTSEYTAPDVDYGGKTVTITGYSYSGKWSILR